MALTKKQVETRAKGIGASDARTIMYGTGKDWLALYNQKVNGVQPVFKPDQLYLMALGTAIEPLTLKRFNDKVKPLMPLEAGHAVHWKLDPFFLFHPDGITHEDREPVQAKFHSGDKNLMELADYYMPQLLHEMLCMGTLKCWLAVTFGHYGRFMHLLVEQDEKGVEGYLLRAMEFKDYLQSGVLPNGMSVADEVRVPRRRDHVWAAGDNKVAQLAGQVLEHYEGAAVFDDALKELKSMFPKDAQTATWVDASGTGLKMIADRAGKIRWVPLFNRSGTA